MTDLDNTDTYESELGHPSAATKKYYQVSVPNIPLNMDTGNLGSSFVRLGSFPSLADTTPLPAGFQNSLNLANLVGKSANTGTDTPPPETFSDGSGLTGPYGYAGDPNYFLGFADDTRVRNDGSSPADRQTETAKLLTKGGWWDHADGNRISTTGGDKVEVIQGNYKMVILSRPGPTLDPGTLAQKAFVTDVSGGHFEEQYASPTPCIKTVEWVQDDGGEWALYQDNGQGRVITKYKGQTVDLFQGSKREAYVGSSGPTTDSSGVVLDPVMTSMTWAQRIETYTGSETKPVAGDITSKTWAQRIETWTGSETTPIAGDVTSYTYAQSVYAQIGSESKPVGGSVTSKTWAQTIETYTGSFGHTVPHVHSYTYADEIQSYTFAASTVTTNMAANNVDVTVGLQESFQLGASLNLALAAEMNIGVTRTSIRGYHTTLEGGKVVMTASKSELSGVRTRVSENETEIHAARDRVCGAETCIGDLYSRLHAANIVGF
jgi:hypothetical protein